MLSFLDLPLELRQEIYNLLFLSPTGTVYPSKTRSGPIALAMPLFRTCSQIYRESACTLYSLNTFQIRGEPAWRAPELLNLLISGKREQPAALYVPPKSVCLGRHFLRKISIPSHGISLNQLKLLCSLMKHFTKLEHVQLVYLGRRGLDDMDIVTVMRLLMDRLPKIRNVLVAKRISYTQAEDISWMILERPYRRWASLDGGPGEKCEKHVWINQFGEKRKAVLIDAPQQLPE